MEIKKTPKADLENKKGTLLLFGLAVAIALVVLMFNWSQNEFVIEALEMDQEIVEVEMTEITRQEEPKQEPPKVAAPVISDVLQVVDNEIETDTDLSIFDMESSDDTEIVIRDVGGQEEELQEEETPVLIAETMPSFEGGTINDFGNWVKSRIKYPTIAAENNITGRVVLSFVVEKDGSLTDLKVLATPDKSLSDEAMRIVKQSPKWAPGEQRGMKVRVQVMLPVVFSLVQ